ncbi:MAG: diacylglycerol kinase family lipid kinase [Actinobacteria bacterium]|nr:diacylglycerol kinase family lipid kinase [Actinomycetota bacterium]MBU4402006.1 diacylglycerol kinase family lipid kinase [Actinomycetota bacterium]MBU4441352.1 diacylglycerol kinase family lipid kinase [Actinomycetota bacterium]
MERVSYMTGGKESPGSTGNKREKKRKPGAGKARPRKDKQRAAKDAVPNARRAMLIINPVAGTGEAVEIWEDLQETLRHLGLDFDYHFTEHGGHAVEIARVAAKKRYGIVAVVGGDGTVCEAVNGLMSVGRESRPRLGVIPTGRGSDFCRTVDIPRDWRTAASLLVSGRHRAIDVGWMEYRTTDGIETGYFINIAGLGFDGEVMERSNKLPEKLTRVVGGIGAYALSLVVTFARYHEKDMELNVDGEEHRVLATTVIIANCRHFGGRMCVAPEAEPDDSLFDVVVIGAGFGSPALECASGQAPPTHSRIERGVARLKMARNIPRVFKGTHLRDESIMVTRCSKVKVSSDDRILLQADGDVIGEGPFAAKVIPGALEIIA